MQIGNHYRVFAPGLPHLPTISGLFVSHDITEDRDKISKQFPGLDFRIEEVNRCGASLTETPHRRFANREVRIAAALAMMRA